MDSDEEVLHRLDVLISTGEQVVRSYRDSGQGYIWSGLPEHQLWSFVTGGAAEVERVAGPNSQFYKQLPAALPQGNHLAGTARTPANTLGALMALRAAFTNGWRSPATAAAPFKPQSPTALEQINLVVSHFHRVARQLRARREKRKTLDVKDEYDVQDLLHALLRLFFDDIRPEEWTPSYAGKASRMDFLLKNERLVVEAKMTRDGLGEKEIGTQLIDDIARYRVHPDCKTLVCFVYDPLGRIGNPEGLERDLHNSEADFTVKVIVAPRH